LAIRPTTRQILMTVHVFLNANQKIGVPSNSQRLKKAKRPPA
jgi:hypothetical protein